MNLFEFCLSFVYFLFWYRMFSSPSRKCVIWRNSISTLRYINMPLEFESEHIWLPNVKNPSSLLTNWPPSKLYISYKASAESLWMWLHGVTSSEDLLISFQSLYIFSGNFISWFRLLCAQIQHVASSLWQLCTWHKPQQVTKWQKPYYSSTLHCLLLAITSSARSFWLAHYWHQPQKGLAIFYTHIHSVVSPFYHSSLSFNW